MFDLYFPLSKLITNRLKRACNDMNDKNKRTLIKTEILELLSKNTTMLKKTRSLAHGYISNEDSDESHSNRLDDDSSMSFSDTYDFDIDSDSESIYESEHEHRRTKRSIKKQIKLVNSSDSDDSSEKFVNSKSLRKKIKNV